MKNAVQGNPPGGGQKSISGNQRTIYGIHNGNIRVRDGEVIIKGILFGILTSIPSLPLGPQDIEVKAGERLTVQGDVCGSIQHHNSYVEVEKGVLANPFSSPKPGGVLATPGNSGGQGVAMSARKPFSLDRNPMVVFDPITRRAVRRDTHDPDPANPLKPWTYSDPQPGTRQNPFFDKIDRNPHRASTSLEPSSAEKPEGKVKVCALFSGSSIEKDYGPYSLSYDGRKFSKYVPGSGNSEPSSDEISRFKEDVRKAAKSDADVSDYVSKNPVLLRD